MSDLRPGRRGAAIVQLEQALKLRPTSASAHATLSNIDFDRGDFELAVAHGEEAVKLAYASGRSLTPRSA